MENLQPLECAKCDKLVACRRNIVQGVGNPSAKILIVKDGISEDEDRQGRIFVGEYSNWLLSMYLHAVDRPELAAWKKKSAKGGAVNYRALREYFLQEVFITSPVLCRGVLTQGDDAGKYRVPATTELNNCREHLHRLIYQIDPWIIVAFGKYSLSGLTRKPPKINLNGAPESMIHIEITGESMPVVYPVLPSYDLEIAMLRGDHDAKESVSMKTFNALASAFEIVERMNGRGAA